MPQGGTIFLGVDENENFTVSGVWDVASLEQSVANQTRNAIEPAPQLNFTPVSVDGRDMLVVEVISLSPLENPHATRAEPTSGNPTATTK